MSSLITREQADGAAQSFVSFNLCDVEQKAREAVDRARDEARRMLTEAVARSREMEHVAAARGERAGYEAGFKKGQEAGRQDAFAAESQKIQQATATVREALLATLTEIENHRHEVLSEAKQDLFNLSVSMAERLCRTRFSQSSDHVQPLLHEVIDITGKQSGLVLRVHPADAEAVEKFIGDIHAGLGGANKAATGGESPICLVADERIERGGCLAERAGGMVDARIETQMARIVSELMGASLEGAIERGGHA